MSIFDKDIVKKEIGYDPNPDKNIEVQIEHYMRQIVDYYCRNLVNKFNMMGWLQYMLDSYMSRLLDADQPDVWKGPYKNIRGYEVRQLKPENFSGMNGFEIHYGFSGELTYHVAQFPIYEDELLNILKQTA